MGTREGLLERLLVLLKTGLRKLSDLGDKFTSHAELPQLSSYSPSRIKNIKTQSTLLFYNNNSPTDT
jgi:hypothetical protein